MGTDWRGLGLVAAAAVLVWLLLTVGGCCPRVVRVECVCPPAVQFQPGGSITIPDPMHYFTPNVQTLEIKPEMWRGWQQMGGAMILTPDYGSTLLPYREIR